MKYITYLEDETEEKVMIIFNEAHNHADIAKKMNVFPRSAGFLTIVSEKGTIAVEVECHGTSTTLDLTPNEEDTAIAKRTLGL